MPPKVAPDAGAKRIKSAAIRFVLFASTVAVAWTLLLHLYEAGRDYSRAHPPACCIGGWSPSRN